MTTTRPEIVIIGAGVIGSSIAYHLARHGRQVLVIDRGEIATEPAASWASAGGVRRQGRHPAEALLAIEAIERWPTLEEELEADLHYRHGGQLLLAETEEEAHYLEAFVQQQHTMGFLDVRLVDGKEAHELAPGLNPAVLAGSYSPADGQANPPATTRAFAQAAQRLGATYLLNTQALSLLMHNARVTGVRTSRGDIEAQHIVLAAGAWSDDLARSIGLRLPIRTLALQMLLSTPAQTVTLQPVLSAVGRRLSLKQLDDGSYFLGGGWPGEVTSDRGGYRTLPESIAGNWSAACGLLPSVATQRIARAWCGLEAQSFDEIPFVGPAPAIGSLTVAFGFSGHGFAISPAVGRAVADQIAQHPEPSLDDLSPARIASFDPVQVATFLKKSSFLDTP